jgi:hypothetical protein
MVLVHLPSTTNVTAHAYELVGLYLLQSVKTFKVRKGLVGFTCSVRTYASLQLPLHCYLYSHLIHDKRWQMAYIGVIKKQGFGCHPLTHMSA